MTIGPEPITSIFAMSFLRGIYGSPSSWLWRYCTFVEITCKDCEL